MTVPSSYAYQWKRAGTVISGATANTYTLVDADLGDVITCTVTGTNSAGSTPVTSAATATITGSPSNTALPVITGTPVGTSTLSVSNGNWVNPLVGFSSLVYTYQWNRGGSPISGATANTYTLGGSDTIGVVLTATVTATNASGASAATSTGVTVVGGILFVQKANANPTQAANPTNTQTFPTAVTVGNTLVVQTWAFDTNGCTVTGGGVATWIKAGSNYNVSSIEIWYGLVTTAAQTVVTVASSTSSFEVSLSAEFAGIAPSSAVDTTTNFHTYSSSVPSAVAPMVASTSGQLLVNGYRSGNSNLTIPVVVSSGFTVMDADWNNAMTYLINPAPGTYTPAYNVSAAEEAASVGVVFNP